MVETMLLDRFGCEDRYRTFGDVAPVFDASSNGRRFGGQNGDHHQFLPFNVSQSLLQHVVESLVN
jgi:hypothetical protein